VSNNELIVIKQVPVIEQHIESIGLEIKERIDNLVKNLPADASIKEMKQLRADLNKEFKDFEDRRKYIKEQISKPYEEFNSIYQKQIADNYKNADSLLKRYIDDIENVKKRAMIEELQDYFDIKLADFGINFVKFEDVGLNVILSASISSLKEQIDAFFDKIQSELTIIYTQEHKDEILYEYKQHRDITKAITTVQNRVKALEEEKSKNVEETQDIPAKNVNDNHVATVDELPQMDLNDLIDVEEYRNYDTPVEEIVVERTITIKCTNSQLNSLYDYLTLNNIEYEEE